jgi:uncharacterized protein involved in type VI secretion and phage assembly
MPISLSPTVKFNGTSLADSWVARFTELVVDREFQVPGRCSLRFSDPGFVLLASNTATLGMPISVTAADGGAVFDGEVTELGAEQSLERQPDLVIVAHDKSHRMGRPSNITTYLQMKYSDVVTKIVSSYGLTAEVDSTDLSLEYMLQVDSDLGLLTEMANRAGFDWWVEGTTLHFKKPSGSGTPVDLTLDQDLLALTVKAVGHMPDSFTVDGWDRTKQAQVTATATVASATVKASSTLATAVASPAGAFGNAVLLTANVAAANQAEADQLAQSLAARAAAAAVTARGVAFGTSAIKPGVSVKIAGAGPLSGTYPVTKVQHAYRAETGFRTRFVAGARTPTSLVDNLGGATAYTRAATVHPALVVGQVTNSNDPANLGRVKVRYPGLSTTDESAWARLVALGGGKGRGGTFVPEVGDEVLVGFEGGDPRQPVVIGGLYGDKVTFPTKGGVVQDGTVMTRRMTSRLGHYLEFADGTAPPDQHVALILAGEQHLFKLSKQQVDLQVPSGIPVNVVAGETFIKFGQDGSIDIEGLNITIKAKNNLTLQGVQGSIKASAQLALEGTAQASMKGAMVQISGDATTAIKGGIVQIN